MPDSILLKSTLKRIPNPKVHQFSPCSTIVDFSQLSELEPPNHCQGAAMDIFYYSCPRKSSCISNRTMFSGIQGIRDKISSADPCAESSGGRQLAVSGWCSGPGNCASLRGFGGCQSKAGCSSSSSLGSFPCLPFPRYSCSCPSQRRDRGPPAAMYSNARSANYDFARVWE